MLPYIYTTEKQSEVLSGVHFAHTMSCFIVVVIIPTL